MVYTFADAHRDMRINSQPEPPCPVCGSTDIHTTRVIDPLDPDDTVPRWECLNSDCKWSLQ